MNQAYQLHCQIQTTPQGVILKIWETLSEKDEARIQRASDFLFRLNFRVDSVEAADSLLRTYLRLIGISDVEQLLVDEIQFITVTPGATEEFGSDDIVHYDRNFGRNA
jgi:hypothetical protein